MNQETKTCQNCQKDFVIESEDFDFYEKIKVPAPTFCPECRLVRKMMWRNERALFRRTCNFCGKKIISVYPQATLFNVYCQECWWSDKWDASQFFEQYEFSKPFFTQFKELFQRIPVLSLYNTNAVNSDYCNYMASARNCYLLLGGKENEGVCYSNRIYFSKDSLDLYTATKLELCYENVQCENSYNLLFSQYCSSCNHSMFLYDCKNCQNCFACTNLRGKQYYIFNQGYSKEEYLKKLKEFGLGSYTAILRIKRDFNELRNRSIHKYAHILKSINTTGDNVQNAKNCKYFFDSAGTDYENSKFSHYVALGLKDSYDIYGLSRGEMLYESIALGWESNENANYLFSLFIKGSNNIRYSYNCVSCTDLFGCIGLQRKSYCILNKQYTKEEYEELVPKIIEHMNTMPYVSKIPNDKIQMSNQAQNPNVKTKEIIYKYGEFFPPELSPFAYNETIAQEYFPLTKDEVIAQGYKWKDREERNYEIDIKTEELPVHIKDVKDDILDKVIECAYATQINADTDADKRGYISENPRSNPRLSASHSGQCTTAFKIIEPELRFYRRMNLPLPRLCPNCRHYERLKQRNPLKLWHRKCQCAGLKSEARLARRSVSEAGEGGSTKSETNSKSEIQNQETQLPSNPASYTNTIAHFHRQEPCPNEFETSYSPDRPEIVYCEKCYQSEVV